MANAFFMEEQLEIHIGNLIRQELRNQGRSVKWFANQIPCTRNHTYKIFSSPSLNTDMLLKISVILDYNFFKHYETIFNQAKVYRK